LDYESAKETPTPTPTPTPEAPETADKVTLEIDKNENPGPI